MSMFLLLESDPIIEYLPVRSFSTDVAVAAIVPRLSAAECKIFLRHDSLECKVKTTRIVSDIKIRRDIKLIEQPEIKSIIKTT